MPLTELFDETLDINATENYDLSVELSFNKLSFCILDGIRNKYILLRSYLPDSQKRFTPEKLKEVISMDDFLSRKYRNTHIVVSSSRTTLIPAALYDPAKKDEYFNLNFPVTDGSIIMSDRLQEPDSYVLYSVSKPLTDLIRESFPGISYINHLRPLFFQISNERKHSGERYIHAHIEADYFNLIIFSGSSLRLFNTFLYRNVSDILYHIMNAFRNLGINQEETIIFSGETEKFDDLFSLASAYIRNIKYAGLSGSFTFSYVFNDIPPQRYINLFSAAICGS